MSALMTPRRRARTRGDRSREQASLFGAASAVPATAAAPAIEEPVAAPDAPAPAAAPEASTTASAHRHGPTLDDMVAGAWEGLVAGAPAGCLVCGTALTPRYAAGPGVVGGRCGGCGSTLG